MTCLPFLLALLSFLFYRLALPTWEWWPLVFLVPLCWYPLIARKIFFLVPVVQEQKQDHKQAQDLAQEQVQNRSPDQDIHKKDFSRIFSFPFRLIFRLYYFATKLKTSFYGQLWLAAVLFWSVVNFWLTFPHPGTALGWILLSFYLGCYLPLFVYCARSLTFQWHFPIWLAMPLSWISVEWLRKHLLGGYSFASLEHVLYRQPEWIQTAEWFGEYTVATFIVLWGTLAGLLLFGIDKTNSISDKSSNPDSDSDSVNCKSEATLSERLSYNQTLTNQSLTCQKTFSRPSLCWKILLVFLLIALPIGNYTYGHFCIKPIELALNLVKAKEEPLKIALLQESTSFSFPVPDELNLKISKKYIQLIKEAANSSGKESERPNLIVTPESCLMDTVVEADPGGYFPELKKLPSEERQAKMDEYLTKSRTERTQWLASLNVPVILGVGMAILSSDGTIRFYNSAYYQEITTKRSFHYDKIHRVMFGEYLPFAEYLPDSFPLKTLCNSVYAGNGPVLFPLTVNGKTYQILVNICFESSIPPLIADQVDQLRRTEQEPDLLINISNDGWFRRTWQVDFHLATHVFRAIENRKPVLSATHAGLSASVAPTGRIETEAQRGSTGALVAKVSPMPIKRSSRLLWKIPALVSFLTLALGLAGIIKNRYRS